MTRLCHRMADSAQVCVAVAGVAAWSSDALLVRICLRGSERLYRLLDTVAQLGRLSGRSVYGGAPGQVNRSAFSAVPL